MATHLSKTTLSENRFRQLLTRVRRLGRQEERKNRLEWFKEFSAVQVMTWSLGLQALLESLNQPWIYMVGRHKDFAEPEV